MTDKLESAVFTGEAGTIVELHGDLDLAILPELRHLFDAVAERETGQIVVSLVHVDYCDSSGLQALILLKRRVNERLRIVVPAGTHVRRLFDVAGLSAAFGLDERPATTFSPP